ncbi:MAG: succinylglutamate desuccinylase [Cyclobacteriaceae bacterium]|jgi:succinylglutamate desuccinylase
MSDRILGILKGENPGPLVVFNTALHGNEKHGVEAFYNIFNSIKENQITINGKIIGLLGNTSAIELNKRYLSYDLNRRWKPEYINSLRGNKNYLYPEDSEMMELREVIEEHSQGDHKDKIMIDLHGTSSDYGNFLVVPEEEEFHPLIKSLHLPVVVDLDKFLEGTLLDYYHTKGFVSFAFEGGIIGSREAVELHVSDIWELLEAAGVITDHDHEDLDHYENKLKKSSANLPKVVKVFHQHWVEEEDEFVKKPSYRNFQRVAKGEQLASDKNGTTYAPKEEMIFLPLYQNSGNDGFVLVEERH